MKACPSPISAATATHSRPVSRLMPIQPFGPRYGGRKKCSGAAGTRDSWAPGGAATHTASRPSPWWLSTKARYWPDGTKKAGAPCESFSVVPARVRQMVRTRSIAFAAPRFDWLLPISEDCTKERVIYRKFEQSLPSDPAPALIELSDITGAPHPVPLPAGEGRGEGLGEALCRSD